MNKGILGFKVFRRRKPACKVVAVLSAFAMLVVGSSPEGMPDTSLTMSTAGRRSIRVRTT